MFFDSDGGDKEGLLAVHLQICHTNLNRKGSNIDETVAKKAISSLNNRPILAYIHEVNNQSEFYGHNIHEDEKGNIVYDEILVGIIPESCNAKLLYDNKKGRKYVEADGYIFEEFTKAAEILRREKECNVSIEIDVKKFSYNAKEKCLNIEKFYFKGVTILGKSEDGKKIRPGMEGANIKLSDFSQKNNSMFENYSNNITEINKKIKELQNIYFDLKNNRKGEFSKMENESNFENNKFVKTKKDSVEINEEIKNVQVLLKNKVNSLYDIVNTEYAEKDNTFYGVTCYDDYIIMYDYCKGNYYKQSYSIKDDVYYLTGERTKVYAEFTTDEEQSALNEMRKNYSSLVEYKKKNELDKIRKQKEKIINDLKYSMLSEDKSYKELVKNMDKYSVCDLEKEIKVIFADYISNAGQFSINGGDDDKVKLKTFKDLSVSNHKHKKNRYGSLFSE